MIAKFDGGQTDWGDFPLELAYGFEVGGGASKVNLRPSGMGERLYGDIDRIVMEDFVLYPPGVGDGPPPWWDELITARLIGKIQVIADLAGVPVDYQGASIKSDALASAAAEDFSTPLYENRHENDATMHGTYYLSRLIAADKRPAPFTLLAIDPGETVGWAIFRWGK